MSISAPLLMVVGLAVAGALGDYFLKRASLDKEFLRTPWFAAGALVYLLCSLGWVFTMRHVKLANIGVVYSVSTVVLLSLMGVLVFGEKMHRSEIAGIGLGLAAILLLNRFNA